MVISIQNVDIDSTCRVVRFSRDLFVRKQICLKLLHMSLLKLHMAATSPEPDESSLLIFFRYFGFIFVLFIWFMVLWQEQGA